MKNQLIPEQRPDKNGHLVTRHVLADKHQSAPSPKLAALSMPVLPSAPAAPVYVLTDSPFQCDPHIPDTFTKVAMTTTGKRMYMTLSEVPEGSDPDSLTVTNTPTFEDELTDDEQSEFNECARVFAHEAAAMANSSENLALPAELIPEGAYVDFNGCAYIPRQHWDDYSFEYTEVSSTEKNGTEVTLHTNQGSISVPADYALPAYSKKLNENAARYSPAQIDEATESALETALQEAIASSDWEDEDIDPDDLDRTMIAPETRKKFRDMIEALTKKAPWAVEASGVSPDDLGSDFYLTSAASGVGFYDRENIPSSAANELTSVINGDSSLVLEGGSIYLGDDKLLYWG